jgi:hypothetical protein
MVLRFCVVLSLLPTIAAADTVSKVTLIENPFNEVLRTRAQISGARLVGFLAAPAGRPDGKVIEVAASIPADWKGQDVCLKVVSADGLYESRNTYSVPTDWQGGRSPLSYPSNFEDEALSYPGAQIAGTLALGDCTQAQSKVAPVYWGKGVESALYLLLNTARSDETFVNFPELPDQQDIICETITTDQRNAFDTRCLIPEPVTRLREVNLVVVSFKNGEMAPEERMTLQLGGPL